MIQVIKDINDKLLSDYKWLNYGFYACDKTENGTFALHDGNEYTNVAFEDNLGNYFYFINKGKGIKNNINLSVCGNDSFTFEYDLVVIAKCIDEIDLTSAIITSITDLVKIKSVLPDSLETIKELYRNEAEYILSKLSDYSIILITFEVNVILGAKDVSCFSNICKCC